MPTYSDVDITITRETSAVTRTGFGMPLILGISKDSEYAEYGSMEEFGEDYSSGEPEYDMAEQLFAQEPAPSKVAIHSIDYTSGTDSVSDLSDELDTLIKSHDDWYFLLCPANSSDDPDEIGELQSWADSNKKLYFTRTTDKSIIADYDSDRTVIFYSSNADSEYPDAAWVGRCAPEDAGSITWNVKDSVKNKCTYLSLCDS